ncbi:MAG: tyrosine-type recombinase/integrase [Firmicutes bacterium]|nr:tyrosine-type recombinase/integrase [Bacillota bacterium]MBQ2042040.1 tyrosine-type recombinase/integrase [Bacillota bacterium]MBQ6671088.1 tyrosine-type recombinase/integrase [Bacillota bacterium]
MNFEDKFEAYMEKEKGSSRSTLSAYISDIREFTDFLAERGKEPEQAVNSDVAAYVMSLTDMGKSNATVNRRLASLRGFYSYLLMIGAVKVNPTTGIKSTRISRKELEYLSISEVEQLLDIKDDTAAGLRDRAMLELMYATGIRASEVCNANISDIDLRIGFISVKSGGKTRMVPIGRPARAALKEYLLQARPELLKKKDDTGALFLSYIGERLTRQGVWKILKQRGDEAGLTDKLSPQILRNSFAAHMVQNGADIKSLQDILGHEDITATRIYLSLTKNRIIDVYDKAFPRA